MESGSQQETPLSPQSLLGAPSPEASRHRVWLALSVRPGCQRGERLLGRQACQGQMVFVSGARSQLSATRRDACRSCRRSRCCQTCGICCALPYTCRWAASARCSRGGGVKEEGKAAAPSGRNLGDKQGRRNPKMKKSKKEDGAGGATATLVRSWGAAGCSGRVLSSTQGW